MNKKHLKEKRELEMKNIKLMALFSEVNPNPLLRLNINGEIVYSNQFANDLFERNFLKQKLKIDLLFPELNMDFHKIVKNDEKIEKFIKWKNKIFATTIVGMSYLDIINIYFYDITGLKETEEKLIEYKNRLKGLSRWQENLLENERTKIAGDLHDSIGQKVSVLKMELQSPNIKFEDKEKLNKLFDSIDSLSREIRDICYELKPQFLKEYGLYDALKNLINRINDATGLNGSIDLIGEKFRLDEQDELTLFRVVQECLNNLIKHSEAEKYSVQLINQGHRLKIIISDDGKGFDVNATLGSSQVRGFGLLNMIERIENIGGKINFNSEIGMGTVIIVEKPMENR